MEYKGVHGNYFHETSLVACAITLYNTCELAHAIHQATLENVIMAD